MKIQEKAMLVRLSISQWTAKKYDKQVSEKVAKQYAADVNAGRYNKALIAQEEIKKISSIVNEVRTFHYSNTLPWGANGEQILPAANYLEYSRKMRDFEQRFSAAVNAFCAAYPVLIDDARARLNGMFCQADYPADVRGRFGFSITVSPIPYAPDFRINLATDEVNAIRQQIEERVNASVADAMADLWQRVHDAVSHMVERLSDKKAVFRDSLVENLSELVTILPRLNITNDHRLETMRQEIEQKLCSAQPDTLRNNPKTRKQTAKNAQAILDAMSGYMGGQAA